MSNVIGVVVIIVATVFALQYAKDKDVWPRTVCQTAAPYGPHDYRCKLYIGQ